MNRQITQAIHSWKNGNGREAYRFIENEMTWMDFATELENYPGVACRFRVSMLCGLLRIQSTQEHRPKGGA